MPGKKKTESHPLGVRLTDLQAMLQPTSVRTTLSGNTLVAHHDDHTLRVEVVPPDDHESANGPIRAVVRVIADLPMPMRTLFQGREAASAAAGNALAALGGLYAEGNIVRVGSRLTIYEGENAWETLQLPLLMFSTLCGTEAILGGWRRAMNDEGGRGGRSSWVPRDFGQVERYLSRVCLCTTDDDGLTAEFPLSPDSISAAVGDHETALFQLLGDQPHPELGGGLFSVLQLPHKLRNAEHVERIGLQLNGMEMAAHDLPPHFGAWCPGRAGNNLAYVSFYPNAMHAISGIAVNAAFWAMNRTLWANAMLAALGVRC